MAKSSKTDPLSSVNLAAAPANSRLSFGRGLALIRNYKGNPEQHRWVFRSTLAPALGGKVFEMGLGTLADRTLSSALAEADRLRLAVGKGEDPRGARVIEREAVTTAKDEARRVKLGLAVPGSLRDWAARFKASQTWRPRSITKFDYHVNNWILPGLSNVKNPDAPKLGDMKIQSIERPMIADFLAGIPAAVLAGIEARGHTVARNVNGLSCMDRSRKIIKQICDFAINSGVKMENPATGIQKVLKNYKPANNPAVSTAEELAKILRQFAESNSSEIVRVAMMTQAYLFQRSDMIAKMEWSEINLSAARWSIPADKMKMDRDHVVYLPRQVVAMLTALQAETGAGRYVFANARTDDKPMKTSSLNNGMQMAMGRKWNQKGWVSYQTAHGFRALGVSFGQKYVACLGAPLQKQVLDIMAAHQLGDDLGTAYERNEWEEMRPYYAQAWADWCDAIRDGAPGCFMTNFDRKLAAQVAAPAPALTLTPEEIAAILAMRAAGDLARAPAANDAQAQARAA